MSNIGIIFALGALVSWTFGDFFIQKTVRAVGNIHALLFICGFGSLVILPFIYRDIPLAFESTSFVILFFTLLISLIAAILDFEALKLGKFSVVEPVYGIELPITVLLSLAIAKENLSILQIVCIIAAFVGIVLTSTKAFRHLHFHKRLIEKGVVFAVLAATAMGVTNFLYGYSSANISPLLTLWYVHFFLGVFSLIVIILRKELGLMTRNLKRYPQIIFAETFFDNSAWLCFAYANTYLPISIATTISEAYIGLAAVVGVVLNRERLRKHQFVGILLIFISIISLGFIG